MIDALKVLRQSDEAVCDELHTRYGMDKEMWKDSQRKSFPFNLSLLSIFFLCVCGLFIAGMHPARNIFSDYNLIACIGTTTLVSIVAFYLTDKGIVEFKEKLEGKGLFGRDLNKIGDHRDETKEKMYVSGLLARSVLPVIDTLLFP